MTIVRVKFSSTIDTEDYPSLEDIEEAVRDLLKHKATWYLGLEYEVEGPEGSKEVKRLAALKEWGRRYQGSFIAKLKRGLT
ncbi:MAG: hypothetical protein QW371_05420 [Candidatus Bathyarchaeia archaeon]